MPSIVKAGVKAESRKKLVEIWKANAAKEAAKASNEAASLGARLEAAQARVRAAFLASLDANSSTKGIRKELSAVDKAVLALSKRPPRTAAQRSALEKELQKLRGVVDAIEKSHRTALLDAFEKTVSAETYRGAMLKAARRSGRLEMKEGKFGGVRFNWIYPWFDRIDWESLTHPQNSFTLEPAYDEDATVSEEFSALAGIASASPEADTGHIFVTAMAVIAGYQMARGQVGAFLTIPAGFETLRLQARIVDISANVTAFAIVGGSWASSGTIAEVTDLTANATRRVEGSINYVAAPLIFYARDVFEGPSIFNAELEIPEEGGEILVTAGIKCDVWSALPAGSYTLVSGTVEKITVELA